MMILMVRSKAVRTRATTTSARKAKTGFQRKATQVEKLRIQIQGAEKTLKNLVEVRKKIPKKVLPLILLDTII